MPLSGVFGVMCERGKTGLMIKLITWSSMLLLSVGVRVCVHLWFLVLLLPDQQQKGWGCLCKLFCVLCYVCVFSVFL